MMHKADYKDQKLSKPEIQARMLKVLYNLGYNPKTFKNSENFENQKIDLFERTNIITEVEQEFNVVFQDNVFENFKNF